LESSFSDPATIRTRPLYMSVAEIGLIGIRFGSVAQYPSTCGTLTGQGCASAVRHPSAAIVAMTARVDLRAILARCAACLLAVSRGGRLVKDLL
jgi:hypothetical protein